MQPLFHATPPLGATTRRHDTAPARACGRRSRHTRRYVATLIHLAQAMDDGALQRLQVQARRNGTGQAMGLEALAQALTAGGALRAD